jgi:DNA-binding transcriptional LysR family regulator
MIASEFQMIRGGGHMAIRSKNLNLIPILQALLKEASVARAAAEVGLSQPAMSGALARLRDVLDDPLLVRVGRSMRLTPRALKMRKQLDEVCAQIELLFQPERFDPSTADLSFRIAAPDDISFLLSGPLLVRLATEAPKIRIEFVNVPIDLPTWMEDSTVDLAVCGDFGYWPELQHVRLFHDRIVAAVARDHPLLERDRVTANDLIGFPGLNHDSGFAFTPLSTKFVTGIPSLDQRSQISTGQFIEAVLLAVGSKVVAKAPASLVERLREILPLAMIEIADEDIGIEICMFWTAVTDEALEYKWLRRTIKECFDEVFSVRRLPKHS